MTIEVPVWLVWIGYVSILSCLTFFAIVGAIVVYYFWKMNKFEIRW